MQGNFSNRTRDVIAYSREEAIRLGHDSIGTEHLLLGILREGEGIAVKILRNLGCDLAALQKALEYILRSSGRNKLIVGNIPLTKQAEQVLKVTYLEAKRYNSDVIGTEHLLLSLLRDEESIGVPIREQFSLTYDAVRAQLDSLIGARGGADSTLQMSSASMKEKRRHPAEQSPLLDTYCRDITEEARSAPISDTDAEDEEAAVLRRVLCSPLKDPLLVYHGGGASATVQVERLARAIVQYEVPEMLFDRRILELDLETLLALAEKAGFMEDRIRRVLSVLTKQEDVIFFIQDLDALAERHERYASRIFPLFRQAVEERRIRCICSASADGYQGILKAYPRLAQVFKVIRLKPPPDADLRVAVMRRRGLLAEHYACTIADETVEAAVALAALYFPDRKMPEQVLDLLDEAASLAYVLQAREQGRDLSRDIKKRLIELQRVKADKDAAVKQQHFEEAARFRDQERALKVAMQTAVAAWKQQPREGSVVVDEQALCQVVSTLTGIDLKIIQARKRNKP